MHAAQFIPFAPAKTTRTVLLVGTLVLAVSLGASPVSAQISDRAQLTAALDSAATAHAADSTVAGVSVAVAQKGDMLLHEGYGKANLEFDVPTPRGAVYNVASVTKQFTAAAILQLAVKDSVQLDASVTEYLPDYDTRGHTITLRHLLHHTSGIRNYLSLSQYREFSHKKLPRDTVLSVAEHEPLRFAPGTAMSYSNTGYFLLARIIEKVSRQPYEAYIEEHLLAPAGMKSSFFCKDRSVTRRAAPGYRWNDEEGLMRRARDSNVWWHYGDGGLCTTAGDLLSWTQALHGGYILPDSMYQEMIKPGHLADGTELRYAMGLRLRRPGGRRSIQHSGGVPGFLSHARYYPDSDLTVVALQNTRSYSPRDLELFALVASMARLTLGKGQKPEGSTYESDPSRLVGRYSGPSGDGVLTVEVKAKDGHLVAREAGGDEELRLEHRSGLTWTRSTPLIEERYRFVRQGGSVTELRVDRFHEHLVLRRIVDR